MFRFDYTLCFALKGEPGFVQNSTVEVSVEAGFTAVSIGYGVVRTAQPLTSGLPALPAGATRPPVNLFSASFSDVIETLSTALDEEIKFPRVVPRGIVPVPKVEFGPKTAAVLQGGLRLNQEF